MSRELFLIIVLSVTAVMFLGMWFGWRSRTRRDVVISTSASAPRGERIARFEDLMYVSSTPAGEPLTRLAIPGLKYRGRSTLDVHTDGIAITVAGEHAVYLNAQDVTGVSVASTRVGKAVEPGGLTLISWVRSGREIESSFRAKNHAEQDHIINAVHQMVEYMNMSSKGNE